MDKKAQNNTASNLQRAAKVNPSLERFIEKIEKISQNKLSQKSQAELENLVQNIIEEYGTDILTGLYNRRKLQEILLLELREFQRNITNVYHIMLLDVDGFTDINNTYGEEIGDKILSYFAWQLKGTLRETDIVGRWGGDEFLIILKDSTTSVNPKNKQNNFEITLNRLKKTFNKNPFQIDEEKSIEIEIAYGSTFFISVTEQGVNDTDINALYEQIILEADTRIDSLKS